MSGVRHGVTRHPCIWWWTSQNDIGKLEDGSTRTAHKTQEVFKLHGHQYTLYVELLEKWKQKEARAKLYECVSILDSNDLDRNV